MIKIQRRFSGAVIFEGEFASMRLCVEAAVSSRVSLRGADLSDAVLRGADLSGAVLRGAVLRGADLSDAVLRDAVLRGAVLRDADLSDAVLRGADLSGAVLRDAVLRGADLSDAVLRDAVLRDAVLTPIRDDMWALLSAAPEEAQALRDALVAGRVDGSVYEGACACIVGTIANARGEDYRHLGTLSPSPSRPAERFALGIKRGDTPENNQASALLVQWTDQWLVSMRAAFGGKA